MGGEEIWVGVVKEWMGGAEVGGVVVQYETLLLLQVELNLPSLAVVFSSNWRYKEKSKKI